jgi:hypothetical protein
MGCGRSSLYFGGRHSYSGSSGSVSKRVGADFISWPYTKFGDYTVRSAYHLARSEKFFVDPSKKGVGIHSVAHAEDRLWSMEETLGD